MEKKISIKSASRGEEELETPEDWLQSNSVGGKYWVRKTTGIFLEWEREDDINTPCRAGLTRFCDIWAENTREHICKNK